MRGGRHTLGVYYDQVQTIEESLENDNVWGEQWIWGPLQLTAGATYARSAPPDRTGGWTEITSGEANFWNSDGVRTPLTVLPGNVGNDTRELVSQRFRQRVVIRNQDARRAK